VERLRNRAGFILALMLGLAIVGIIVALNNPALIAWRILTSKPEYIVLAALFDLVSIVFYALAWIVTARALGLRMSVEDGIVASILGLFADKLVASASISCEAVRIAYIKSKYEDISYEELVATIMVHRFLYNAAFISLILAAFIDLTLSGYAPQILGVLLALAVVSTIVASYVLVRPESLKGLASRITPRVEVGLSRILRRNPIRLSGRLNEFIDGISRSVKKASGRKPHMLLAAVLMILQWVAGAAEFYSVFAAVGHKVSLWVALLVFPMHCFLTALPVGLPAALGVVEAGTLFMLVAFGVDGATAMAVTLITRGVEVWFEIALALLIIAMVGLKEYGPQLLKYAEELAAAKAPFLAQGFQEDC